MAVCTFFGHSECPDSIAPLLQSTIEGLICDHSVTVFYVGNHGHFDALVLSSLQKTKEKYPWVEYAVVLAYMPQEKTHDRNNILLNTILPEGIEKIHPRFAISWCNKWMLRQSEYVITYITHSWGGAAQFAEMAAKQHKTVYNIAEIIRDTISFSDSH